MSFWDGLSDFFGNMFMDAAPAVVDATTGGSGVGDVLADVGKAGVEAAGNDKGGGGFWSDVGGAIASPSGLSTILTTGLGLYSGLAKEDALKRSEEQAALDKKNQLLLEIAKAKDAAGRGGSGGGANAGNLLAANNAIIEAVRSGYDDKQGALNSWANNYLRAYGK